VHVVYDGSGPKTFQGLLDVLRRSGVFCWYGPVLGGPGPLNIMRAKTAPLLVSEMMSSLTGVDWGVLFAAVTIQLVPVVAFVWIVQRWLVAGLTAGAVKG
jgi:hypothetical protein